MAIKADYEVEDRVWGQCDEMAILFLYYLAI